MAYSSNDSYICDENGAPIEGFEVFTVRTTYRANVIGSPVESGQLSFDNKVVAPYEVRVRGKIVRDGNYRQTVAKLRKMLEDRDYKFYSVSDGDGLKRRLILKECPLDREVDMYDLIVIDLVFIQAMLISGENGKVDTTPHDDENSDSRDVGHTNPDPSDDKDEEEKQEESPNNYKDPPHLPIDKDEEEKDKKKKKKKQSKFNPPDVSRGTAIRQQAGSGDQAGTIGGSGSSVFTQPVSIEYDDSDEVQDTESDDVYWQISQGATVLDPVKGEYVETEYRTPTPSRYTFNLVKTPNQSFYTSLVGSTCEISLRTFHDVLLVSLTINGFTAVAGVRAVPNMSLFPKFISDTVGGEFMFSCPDGDIPHYSLFDGHTCVLTYIPN